MKKAIKSLAFTLAMLMVISIIQICTIGLFASEDGSMQLISAENAASTITNSTVNIGDVNFRGGSQQIGYFNAPAEMLPFDSGIVLTTGDVGNIFKCSNASSSFGFAGFDRITKLYNESGFSGSTNDAAVLSFSITPDSPWLSFNYFFASTEYNQSAKYNDIFALWVVDDMGTADTSDDEWFNIAKLPDGKIVSIQNTVSKNGYNTASGIYNPIKNHQINGKSFGFLGYTNSLVADATTLYNSSGEKVVQSGKKIKIYLAIADSNDSAYDSAIFIQANSLSYTSESQNITLQSSTFTMIEGSISEMVYVQPEILIGSKTGYMCQWLSSTDNITYSPISGQIANAFYIPTSLSKGEYYFKCQVSKDGFTVDSHVAHVIILPKGSQSAICTISFVPCDDMKNITSFPNSIKIESGKKLSNIPEAKHSVLEFGGWYLDKEYQNSFDSSQSITSDIVLYAKWVCTHNGKIQSITDTAPTCTSSGVGHTVCTICGETLGENIYIPALGHDYKVSESKEATCTESGYMKYTCVRCADSYTIDIYADHKYQLSETHAATCTEDGYKLYKCSSCGATYREEIPAGQHEYTSELIKQATTEEEGTIRYTCAKCGISYEIAVPKLKAGVNVLIIQDRNSWDTATNLTVLNKLVDDGYIAGWNTISSSSLSSFDLTPYGIVMIADDQYSSTYGNLKAAGDKIDAYVQGGGVLLYGACDNGWTNGNIDYAFPGGATKGNYYSSRNYIIDKLHPVVTAALTDGKGLTDEILYHNYCSHSYFKNLPADARIILQDSHGNPTLAEYALGKGYVILNGLTWEHAYKYLTYFSSYSYATRVYDDLIVYAASLANGHTHTYDDGEVIAPACTEEGYTLHTCTECGGTYRDNFTEAKGHIAGEWFAESEATCTTAGMKKLPCTVCGEAVETEAIPAFSHNFVYRETVAATCDKDGYVLYICANEGCGAEKRDAIIALGHDYGDDNVCDRCGNTLPVVHEHEYTETVINPTCTTMGYTLHTCSCGASYKGGYIEPSGHKWDDGTVIAEKTCTKDGIMKYSCKDCDASYEAVVSARHTFADAVIKDKTCTEDGEKRRICTACGYTESEVIPAGHNWDDGIEITAPTCTEAGKRECTCTACGVKGEFDVPALGHEFYDGKCLRCGKTISEVVNDDLSHLEYGMYFKINDIESNYGPELINEYGVLLDHNNDAKLEKVAVYLTQDGRMWRRCIACTGTDIKYATYVPYLSYDSNIKYTGLNSAWINTFALSKNASGIWNYSNYTTIGVNLEDKYGNLLLTLHNIGKAGTKTRVFDDLNEMIEWLGEKVPHENVEDAPHEFEYKHDETSHWLECYCGYIKDKTEHDFTKQRFGEDEHWKDCACGYESAKTAHTFGEDSKCTECGCPHVKFADLDGDGKIDVIDLILIRKLIVGYSTDSNLLAADINCDGNVDAFDLVAIRRYIAGYNVRFGK